MECRDSKGLGDSANSWALDYYKGKKWHKGKRYPFGAKMREIGTVCICVDVEAGEIRAGWNGNYAAPSGVAFTDEDKIK